MARSGILLLALVAATFLQGRFSTQILSVELETLCRITREFHRNRQMINLHENVSLEFKFKAKALLRSTTAI